MEVENIPQKPPQNEEEINKKNKTRNKKPKKIADSQKSATTTTVTLIENSNNNTTTTKTSNNSTIGDDYSGIKVSMFDDCVDNHLKEMEMIHKLCEEDESSGLVDDEIERIASNITFLREWRYFNYSPRTIRFASEKGCPNGNVAVDEITLSQFSAAMVPNCDAEEEIGSGGVASSTNSRKDFALYVGGLVWSLDWCPRTDQETNTGAKCEFIAVAAHPPDSTYHKQGVPLSGRGMVQIWCLLNHMTEDITTPVGNVKRKYKVSKVAKTDENKPVRPRGRPRKNAVVKNSATVPEGQTTQALVVHLPENPSLAPADKAILSLHNDITPVSEEEKHQNYADNEKLHNIAEEEKHQMEEKKQKNPRGRIRKNIMDKTLIEDPEGQFIPALAVCLPEDTSIMPPLDKNLSIDTALKKGKGKKRKAVNDGTVLVEKTSGICSLEELPFQAVAIEVPESINNISPAGDCILDSPALHEEMGKKHNRKEVLATDLECTLAVLRRKSRNKKICNSLDSENNGLSNCDEGVLPSLANLEENYLRKDSKVSEGNDLGNSLSDPVSGGCQILKNDVLPKAVLCVGHDGKVAWDVKWRPLNADIAVNKHRMGYLAVVLGNGSLEVWEVPSVQVINRIYASRHAKGTDPRFAKLNPVFRCSILKYAGKHSMPLTVEWSTSPPHDLILAGCHDGVVALWKFSVDVPSEDVRPLLCFSAETGPIRSLSWAPFEGDPESSNIFVTAGHGGLKFWDLRDPFRPLWDANPSQRFLYGLDWVPDPRCVLVSYDDGTLRMLSLSRAAYDVPVTGQPFNGTQQQGLHSYSCSSFAVWSIHVSRRTGMVAYCCADGTVLYFQLTHKAVDRDPLRNRAPHFLCGSLANEESTVTMNTQLPGSPHRMKKSATEWANTPRPSRTVASGLSQSKRTRKGAEKSQKPDDQVLALDYGDDTESGVTNKTHNSVKGGKGKTSESSKAKDDQALISVVEDRENTKRKPELKEESIKAFEAFPPKIVSMYRVRWNLNKGSERWLSYGGAAGIVRCQEIFAPKFDKKCLK